MSLAPRRLAVLALCAVCIAPAPPNGRRRAPDVAELDAFIAHEMRQKDLPAFTIALVDDQHVVWSKDYGTTRGADSVQPTSATVYRVGAVSQIVTDIAVMQVAARGSLDLDAPVTRYAPGLHLATREPVTLRSLMEHRAGLDRDPPVGGRADEHAPPLAAVAASLNESPALLVSGRVHPSDAGIALAGYVLETTQHVPFAQYVRHAVLAPLGMSRSTFARDDSVARHLAPGTLWTYDPRTMPGPTFDVGVAPAENLYSTTADLARLLSAIFADGRGPGGQVLKPGVIANLLDSAGRTDSTRTVLGFRLTEFDGRRALEQDGAIGGFSTAIAALPDDKLGVVAITTVDGATDVTEHVARLSLRLMLAARRGQDPPPIDTSIAIPDSLARALAGHYVNRAYAVDLVNTMGHVYLEQADAGPRQELRLLHDTLVSDGRLTSGARVPRTKDGAIVVAGDTLRRVAKPEPEPIPSAWRGLIGEYGPDSHTTYVLERGGALQVLADWFVRYPLRQISADTFAMPRWGAYADERVTFARSAAGRATRLTLGGVPYERRATGPEDGSQFRITPLRPPAQLRTEALASQPPHETGTFRPSDLVELITLDSTIKLDIRYASSNNFMGTPLYEQARAFMQRPAAQAVVRASAWLHARGYGLLIHDAYRPWFVTKMFWDATPDDKKVFVADPSQGSRHNRGCAVDLTLYDLSTGRPEQMTGGYDEMTDRSYPDYPGGTSRERWLRALLRQAMEMQGFSVYEAEWWHFDYKDWREYGIGNVPFDRIAPGA
jgi:D-alanyl-D-alanine dipeptidase/CubicO group peptidase (beta-lactamase class C family)